MKSLHQSHHRQHSSRSHKRGLPPGSLVYVGQTEPTPTTIHAFEYGPEFCRESTVTDISQLKVPGEGQGVLWINLDGLADTELLRQVGEQFNIHALTMEDILNTQQRPKIEDFDHFFFVVLKMLEIQQEGQLRSEQVSLILGNNLVISFLEDPGDLFDSVRTHLRQNKGRIRKAGADFLLYALMDVLVDGYFAVIEKVGEQLEVLEDALMQTPQPETLKRLHALRYDMIDMRKSVWPLRDVLTFFQRVESPLIQPGSVVYFRDVYDHTVHVIDNIESNRDVLAGLADLYLSSVSYQLNVVMKVLTMIATIFIPLTFITSIYGMNFKHMPEINWEYGYVSIWLVLVLVTAGMLLYFRRHQWL